MNSEQKRQKLEVEEGMAPAPQSPQEFPSISFTVIFGKAKEEVTMPESGCMSHGECSGVALKDELNS